MKEDILCDCVDFENGVGGSGDCDKCFGSGYSETKPPKFEIIMCKEIDSKRMKDVGKPYKIVDPYRFEDGSYAISIDLNKWGLKGHILHLRVSDI